MANALAVDKFLTYIEVEHAQSPDITSLYPANIGSGRSRVRGKRGYSLVVGRGESLFWGSHLGFFGGNAFLG